MTAYELSDQLIECITDGSTDLVCVEQAAQMLRQQADRIAELETKVKHYKNKIEYLDKREVELLAMVKNLENDNADLAFRAVYAEKTLHIIERHYDQLESIK